jgi:hypothetical protein
MVVIISSTRSSIRLYLVGGGSSRHAVQLAPLLLPLLSLAYLLHNLHFACPLRCRLSSLFSGRDGMMMMNDGDGVVVAFDAQVCREEDENNLQWTRREGNVLSLISVGKLLLPFL